MSTVRPHVGRMEVLFAAKAAKKALDHLGALLQASYVASSESHTLQQLRFCDACSASLTGILHMLRGHPLETQIANATRGGLALAKVIRNAQETLKGYAEAGRAP